MSLLIAKSDLILHLTQAKNNSKLLDIYTVVLFIMNAQTLFQQASIWRAKELIQPPHALQASGYGELDQALGGGWPKAGMVEINYAQQGIGELNLLLPLLGQQTSQDKNSATDMPLQVWINPPQGLQGQALVQAGINLHNLLIVRCQNPQQALWAAEQSLQCPNCQHVVLWGRNMRTSEARRLQCAAKDNDSLLFWLREQSQPKDALPISARLSIQANQHGLQLQIIKLQGQWPKPDSMIAMHKHYPHLYSASPATAVAPHSNVVPIR